MAKRTGFRCFKLRSSFVSDPSEVYWEFPKVPNRQYIWNDACVCRGALSISDISISYVKRNFVFEELYVIDHEKPSTL